MSRNAEQDRNQAVSAVSMNPYLHLPTWVALVVIAGGCLMALGAILAWSRPSMLVDPNAVISSAVHVYAGYFAVRNLVLAVAMAALLAFRARHALGNLLVIVGFIQLLDACMDCLEGRWVIVAPILALGVLFIVAAARVTGPFWQRRSWF
jgi:hypothetical protein